MIITYLLCFILLLSSSYIVVSDNQTQTADKYDLLIITTDVFEGGFLPLKNAHDAQGIHTEIKTIPGEGTPTPEEIRNLRYP